MSFLSFAFNFFSSVFEIISVVFFIMAYLKALSDNFNISVGIYWLSFYFFSLIFVMFLVLGRMSSVYGTWVFMSCYGS